MPSNIPKSHEKSRRKKGESGAPNKNYGASPKRLKECARLRVSASPVSWLGVTDKTAEFAES